MSDDPIPANSIPNKETPALPTRLPFVQEIETRFEVFSQQLFSQVPEVEAIVVVPIYSEDLAETQPCGLHAVAPSAPDNVALRASVQVAKAHAGLLLALNRLAIVAYARLEDLKKEIHECTDGAAAPSRENLTFQGLPTLQSLVEHLQLDRWDTIIVGDGSGSSWINGAGWAGVLIDSYSNSRKLFYRAMNVGTVSIAEMMPYLYAMIWYAAPKGHGTLRRQELARLNKRMDIHIVTDSEYVASCADHPASRHAHTELWTAFDAYRASGFNMVYHHVGRDIVNLNVLVDQVARRARKDLQDSFKRAIVDLQADYPELPDDVDIYDFSNA